MGTTTFTGVANYAQTTLNGGINDSVTSVTLLSGAAFPQTGNFIAVMWSSAYTSPQQDPNREIVLATLSSGNVFTITRAQEGTAASSHASGDYFALVITAGKMTELQNAINARYGSGDSVNFADLTIGTNSLFVNGATAYPPMVGIGTIIPGKALDIVGSHNSMFIGIQCTDITHKSGFRADASTGYSDGRCRFSYYNASSAEVNFGITLGGYGVFLVGGAAAQGFLLGTDDNIPLVIGTNNIERMRIAAGGLISIQSLTASLPVVTDASKNLASVSYATFKSSLAIAQVDVSGLTTTDTPQFARLGIGAAADATASLSVNGLGQFKGTTLPTAGSGVEIASTNITCYDRTGGAYKDLIYNALSHEFRISGTKKLKIDSSGYVNLPGLTVSEPVVTDASGNLASVTYATFKTSLAIAQADVSGLTTGDSPTFAGLVVPSITPTANFALNQNSVAVVTSVASGAIASTIYLSAGSVGIGTTPSNKLHALDGSTHCRLTAEATASNKIAGLKIIANGVTHEIQNRGSLDAPNNRMSFFLGGSERAYLDGSGNLNILGLTASEPVVTDASKNLASVSYATFKSSLAIAQVDVSGLTTASNVQHAKLGLGQVVGGNTIFSITGLPTSTTNLSAGDIWVDTTAGLNILKIV